ncbi:MAG: pyruvate carboxyltransferase [Chloroflexi bacterium]|jgi:hydroxymethylglutaryl-CoA lyase|nr:pyruvate carboxyltransferase [Chloroflexota bacterium]
MTNYPTQVSIREVGPRDGLQNEAGWVPTGQKIALINALANTGLKRIEAVSFVHPKAIPQMRDAAEVIAGIERVPGVNYSAIVPNAAGARRAVAAAMDEVEIFLSASESHNRKNVRMSVAESLAAAQEIAQILGEAKMPFDAVISTAFGCPYEGDVPVERVMWVAEKLLELTPTPVRITLGDTTGMANPVLVDRITGEFQARFPGRTLSLHFHNTRGSGLANVLAGLQRGVTHYDSSLGGLGGCPYAPGATGNITTEDLVNMLHDMGISTGIDLEKLLECARLAQDYVGHELPGQVLKAGPRTRLAPF